MRLLTTTNSLGAVVVGVVACLASTSRGRANACCNNRTFECVDTKGCRRCPRNSTCNFKSTCAGPVILCCIDDCSGRCGVMQASCCEAFGGREVRTCRGCHRCHSGEGGGDDGLEPVTWSEADEPQATPENDCRDVPEEPVEEAESVVTEPAPDAPGGWTIGAAVLVLLGAASLMARLTRGSR